MGGIEKHDAAEFRRRFRRVYIPAIPCFCQFGNLAGMVYVRVSQKNAVYVCHGNRQIAVFVYIRALFHAAVNENSFPVRFQQSA